MRTYNRSGQFFLEIYGRNVKEVTELSDQVESILFAEPDRPFEGDPVLEPNSGATIEVDGNSVHVSLLTFSFTTSRDGATLRADIYKWIYAALNNQNVRVTPEFNDRYKKLPQVVVRMPQTQKSRQTFG